MCSSILKTREENIRYYLSNRIFKYIQEPTFLISSNRRIPCPNACVHKIAKKKKKKNTTGSGQRRKWPEGRDRFVEFQGYPQRGSGP